MATTLPSAPPTTATSTQATQPEFRRKRNLRPLRIALYYAFIIPFLLIWLIPIFMTLITSVRSLDDITLNGPFALPSTVEWGNFPEAWEDGGLSVYMRNSFIITIPATVLVVLIAAFAAYAFAWMDFPGRNILFVTLVGLLVVPLQVTLIPVLQFFRDFTPAGIKINGTFLAVWLAHTGYGLPFAIYLLRNYFGSLPKEVFESAAIDGAAPGTAFFRLALPMSDLEVIEDEDDAEGIVDEPVAAPSHTDDVAVTC